MTTGSLSSIVRSLISLVSTLLIVSYGRHAAEDMKGHIERADLITREIADAIHADDDYCC